MPAIDVTETDGQIEITAELPGLEEKDVQVNVADNVLTIRGEKKAEKEDKQKDYHVVERSYGSFYRAFELPAGVDADKIKADISKGVLKVTVPKPAPKQAKKIDVKAACADESGAGGAVIGPHRRLQRKGPGHPPGPFVLGIPPWREPVAFQMRR